MARLPLVNPDDPGLDPRTAAMLREVAEGSPIGLVNMHRTIANHPPLMRALWDFSAVVTGPLTGKQFELTYLTSAVAMDCFY